MAGSALGFLAGGEPETVAVHFQDVDMMGQAIEQGAGQPFRTEDRSPFIEGQIAGHQGGAAFVALAEDLEEQLRTDRRERHIVSTAAAKCARWRRKSVPVGLREKGRKALEFGIAARIEPRGA